MKGLTVEEILEKHHQEGYSLQLRNKIWCLCYKDKVVNRITSKSKIDKVLKELYKN